MFGTNDIVGKRFFKTAPENTLLVTSRFFSLQGEGPYRGHPAYFIRLAKCNLACSFCDTFFDEGDWCTVGDILEESQHLIHHFFDQQGITLPTWAAPPSKKIVLVITGGEPLLQPALSILLKKAYAYFQHTQIESNGILSIDALPEETTLVVSPKCLEKKNKVGPYLKPNHTVLARANALKFVLSAPSNTTYKSYSEIPPWAHEWAEKTGKPVFISPMNHYNKESLSHQKAGFTLEERSTLNETRSFWEPGLLDSVLNQKNHEYAAAYCMQYGFILNLQLHLFASLP